MSERSVVQEPLLKYANEIGWTRVSRAEVLQMRGEDATALYFGDVLKAQLLKRNKEIIDESNFTDGTRKLRQIKPTLEGNQHTLAWIRGEKSTFVATKSSKKESYFEGLLHNSYSYYNFHSTWM